MVHRINDHEPDYRNLLIERDALREKVGQLEAELASLREFQATAPIDVEPARRKAKAEKPLEA